MTVPKESRFFFIDFTKEYPVVVRGEGNYVYDGTGKKYLDAAGGGVAVINIGHGVEEVIEAIVQQARRLSYFAVSHFANEPQLQLAEKVIDMAPRGMGAVYFLSSGSEAIEYGIKVARMYHLETGNPSKRKIISRWQGYHGSTLLGLSLSGRIPRRRPFSPMLLDMPHIEPSYCYRCPFGKVYGSCEIECAQDLEKAILREGAENVAAFIAEPIVGATAGALTPPREYFPMIREICDRYNVLLIVDEVMTGFGRTGRNFGIEHWNVTPDLIAAGKGISGGYLPLAACIIHERIARVFREEVKRGVVGPTHGGNPLSCAAGLAVLQHLERHGLVARCARMGEVFFAKLDILRQQGMVGDIRGKGLFAGIELVADQGSKQPFAPEVRLGERVGVLALERGLSVYPGSGTADGIRGDHILLAPPLTITEEEMDFLVSVLSGAIQEVEREVGIAGDTPGR